METKQAAHTAYDPAPCAALLDEGRAVLLFDGRGELVYLSPEARRTLERLGVGCPARLSDFPPPLQAALRASAPQGERAGKGSGNGGLWAVELPLREVDSEWLRGMAEAEQMVAVGQLAAAVAQEIGGPNTSIQVTADRLLEGPLGQDPETRECLRRILSQTGRIAHLTRQLIALADPGRVKLSRVDVNEVAGAACELMAGSFRARGIEMGMEFAPGPVLAVADRNYLLQALVNLLLNARTVLQSWTGCRRVVVRTGTTGERVFLQVEDSGPGVAPEAVSRIFLPFVSTTGGTGMGLYLTRQIMVEQGGGVRVTPRNALGGATFTLHLDSAREES